MKNKGFTLIELLAVVLLIGITLVLVFTSVKNIMIENKNTEFKNYEKIMKTSANLYFEKKPALLEVTLDQLIEDNLIKPINDEYICTGKVVKNNNTVELECKKDDVPIWPSGE